MIESEQFVDLFRVIFPQANLIRPMRPTLPCCRSTSAGFRRIRSRTAAAADVLRSVCLQHRGRRARAIVRATGRHELFDAQGHGLVSQVFGREELAKLKGTRAIGHARYSTTGTQHDQKRATFRGRLCAGSDGNSRRHLINADVLPMSWNGEESFFQTTADSEIICICSR